MGGKWVWELEFVIKKTESFNQYFGQELATISKALAFRYGQLFKITRKIKIKKERF